MWFLSGFCYWLLISTSFLLPYFFLFFLFHTHSCDILLSSSISFFLVPVASICSPFCSPLFSLLRPLFFLFFSLSPTPPLLFYLLPLYTSLSSFSTSSLSSPLHLRSLPSPLLSSCFFSSSLFSSSCPFYPSCWFWLVSWLSSSIASVCPVGGTTFRRLQQALGSPTTTKYFYLFTQPRSSGATWR